MKSFVKGDKHFLHGVNVTDDVCDEMEATKDLQFNENIWIVSCRGKMDRLIGILLSEGCVCFRLNLGIMSRCLANVDSWKNLGMAMASCTHLTDLTIGMTEIPVNGMAAFARTGLAQHNTMLQNGSRLEVLHLNNTQWDAADDGALATALSQNQSLRVLHLTECGLQDTRVAVLVHAIRHHPSLVELGLPGNKVGEETSVALAELLTTPAACPLQKLYLGNALYQHHGRQRPKLNIHMIAAALRHNNKLSILDLSDNNINDDDLDVLARCLIPEANDKDDGSLQHGSALRTLILARNCITDVGLSRLLYRWLPHIRNLKTLALWGNLTEYIPNSFSPLRQTDQRRRRDQDPPTSILQSQVIKAMIDLEDVELIKAVSIPEQVQVGLWPFLLQRLSEVHQRKTSATKPKHDWISSYVDQ